MLESFRHHNLIRVPHLLHKVGKRNDQISFVTQVILQIKLSQVHLVFDVILMQHFDIGHALKS